MEVNIITREDLDSFRFKLLEDIKELFSEAPKANVKPWLRAGEVRKLLGISAGSLQNLRVSGRLKSSKIGGIHYYRFSDIEGMMNNKHVKG